jgi:hypothetical protein
MTAVTFEPGPYVYRGTPFTATAQVTGANLDQSVHVDYSGDCTNVTVADGCTATATFAGDQNHDPSTDSKSITITRAPSVTTVTVASATYDGHQHGGTAIATGAGGLNLPLNVTYVGINGTNYPATTTAPTNVGEYEASAAFAGDTNHTGSNASATMIIRKATLTGFASTQSALNIAKQGALVFTLSNITGLQGTDLLATALSTAFFTLKIGANTYSFAPSVSLNTSTNTVTVTYSLKNGGDAGLLAADLQALNVSDGVDSTSASNASLQAIDVCMESQNYTFSEEALTKLFNSTK